MNTTLVVLAAGMASRYGSLKQIDKFGPSGESIIDYSIYDAIEAGFNKVVFVIRKEFSDEFKEIFEPRFADGIKIDYAYQELNAFMEGCAVPANRNKPWGTAHAVLTAKNVVHDPFAVINADDFYGKDAFRKAYRFLTERASAALWANICYELGNTLSDYGSVGRGICETDEDNNIVSVIERTKVYRENSHLVFEETGQQHIISSKAKASMNFWCFTPEVFDLSIVLFHDFLYNYINEPKSEFFIPYVADEFIKQGRGNIKAITTSTQWFGVTYKEDKPVVQKCIDRLIQAKIYPKKLWEENRRPLPAQSYSFK
jgi:NDP-sugar pyrophosphorylase family protein